MITDLEVCARKGCDSPLNHGRKYCSTTCANVTNGEMRKAKQLAGQPPVEDDGQDKQIQKDIQSIRSGVIPAHIEDAFISMLGHDGANAILGEVEDMFQEEGVGLGVWPEWMRKRYPVGFTSYQPFTGIPQPSKDAPTEHKIEPDTQMLSIFGQGYVSDIRPKSDISYADIDRLLKLGPCVMAARLKKGPIMSALSGKRKWFLKCSNPKLKAVIEADLERLFLRHVQDMLTALDYGAAFGSVIWERKTAEHIGVESGVGKGTQWYVVDKIEWAHPSTITRILREQGTNKFKGFQHRRKTMRPPQVVVDPMQALLITYGGKFGNMWGESAYEIIYDFAFWYEIIMRSFLRYLQRMSTPVCVVYGPNRGTSKRPDGQRISNPQYGLLLAGAAAMSSAIYLPSERDLQSGQPLWRIEYLDTDQKGDQFIAALQYLGTQITRGMLIGDRSFTQDGTTGSYRLGDIHNKLSQVDNDFIFKRILGQLNDYLIKRYAMFNVDFNNPPLTRLVAEVIDPDEQEVLMKLFATAGNIKFGEGTPLDRVDWEEAFRSINVPILTDEEFEKLYEEHMDRKQEAQKMFQQTQPQTGTGQAGQAQQPPGQAQGQPAASSSNGKQARLEVLDHLVDGGMVPVLLTQENAKQLIQGKEQGVIYLDNLEAFDEHLDSVDGGVELQRRGRRPRPARGRPATRKQRKTGDPAKDPDFESKHPRGKAGKFAKKAEEATEEETETQDDRDLLDQDEWPGARTWVSPDGEREIEIKGVVTLDGIKYVALEGTSKEMLLRIHAANQQMLSRASEVYGRDFESPTVIVDGAGEDTGGAALPNPFSEEGERSVIIFGGLGADERSTEGLLFHETLHTQPRTSDFWDSYSIDDQGIARLNVSMLTEEAFNGIIANAYYERYDIPVMIGWNSAVSAVAKAAQANGWDKQKLYDFAVEAHQIDGPQYRNIIEQMFRGTGLELRGYPEALNRWWGGWVATAGSALPGEGDDIPWSGEHDDWDVGKDD